MSDKQAILDKLAELVKTASDLEDALDVARDGVESDWQERDETIDELADDLEANLGALDETPTDYDQGWYDGWEAAIEHVRQY